MATRYEVRFSGSGGQGVVLAGIILAEAAGLKGGLHVVQTVSYGPQVRGGNSDAELVLSDAEIDYPKPMGLDLLIPFTQQGCDEGVALMKPRGIVVLDPQLVDQRPEGWVAIVPLTRLAVEATGRSQMANMVALGAVAALSPVVDLASVEAAVRERAPQGLEKSFLLAVAAGHEAARKAHGQIVYEKLPSPED